MPVGLLQTIKLLSRRSKMAIAMAVDAIIAAAALWMTYAAPTLELFPNFIVKFWWILPLASATTIVAFYVFRLYHTVIRFAGSRFFLNSMIASLFVAWIIGVVALINVYSGGGRPTAIFVIYPFYLMVGTAGIRLLARRLLEVQIYPTEAKKVSVIYGCGSGGTQLFSSIRYGSVYKPIAFVDDDKLKQGQSVYGLRVYAAKKLPSLIKTQNVTTVLLAIPSTEPIRRAEIVKYLQTLDVQIETMPSFSELVTAQATYSDLRTLSIDDILTRTEVVANEELAGECVTGKSVLVTGAGGSIGSELCRQILQRNPSTIVLFDIAESALFFIQQEIEKRISSASSDTSVFTVLGSVTDESRLREVFLQHKVESVFHAAAYKHVSMLETNPLEGARNNIVGTRCVIDAANWASCTSLVVVSTDKAVKPTSFMGATKRIAELLIQAKSSPNSKLRTCLVRFGNVLGSSGSVVPIFQEQINCGGPVTVTDPNATRYFMTIPEASQLILQAGAMGSSADVFVLQMGEPIKIIDLAKRMVALAGKTIKDENNPTGEIEITFTSLRPGEKLHEQLSHNENLEKTAHEMILMSKEEMTDRDNTLLIMNRIEEAILLSDVEELILVMKMLIPDFIPSWDSTQLPNVDTLDRSNKAQAEKIQ